MGLIGSPSHARVQVLETRLSLAQHRSVYSCTHARMQMHEPALCTGLETGLKRSACLRARLAVVVGGAGVLAAQRAKLGAQRGRALRALRAVQRQAVRVLAQQARLRRQVLLAALVQGARGFRTRVPRDLAPGGARPHAAAAPPRPGPPCGPGAGCPFGLV